MVVCVNFCGSFIQGTHEETTSYQVLRYDSLLSCFSSIVVLFLFTWKFIDGREATFALMISWKFRFKHFCS